MKASRFRGAFFMSSFLNQFPYFEILFEMRKTYAINYLLLMFVSVLCFSCEHFQDDLFSEIQQREMNRSQLDTFDLRVLTDFQWDSVLFVEGNESVPEFKEFIEERLNRHSSNIHWEKRPEGMIDKSLKYTTEDLPAITDRFYFLTPMKTIITRDIDHFGADQGMYFQVISTSKDTVSKSDWISRDACKIVCS